MTSVRADLDGDGRPDRFVVYARLADRRPVSWWAEAMLAGSGRPTAPVRLPTGRSVGGNAGVYPRVAGAAEANSAPGDEVFVQLSADIYHGAARPFVAMYAVPDGRVVPITGGGKLFVFPTSGVSRFGDGARCDSHSLFTLTHVEIEPYGWLQSEHAYRWSGLELVPDGTGRERLPPVLISDPRVYRNYELICGTLRISQVTDSYPSP